MIVENTGCDVFSHGQISSIMIRLVRVLDFVSYWALFVKHSVCCTGLVSKKKLIFIWINRTPRTLGRETTGVGVEGMLLPAHLASGSHYGALPDMLVSWWSREVWELEFQAF